MSPATDSSGDSHEAKVSPLEKKKKYKITENNFVRKPLPRVILQHSNLILEWLMMNGYKLPSPTTTVHVRYLLLQAQGTSAVLQKTLKLASCILPRITFRRVLVSCHPQASGPEKNHLFPYSSSTYFTTAKISGEG